MTTEPSAEAKDLVGKEITVSSDRKGKSGTGLVEGVRLSHSTIHTADGVYRGIEYYIAPNDGRKRFWTVAMPDTHGGRLDKKPYVYVYVASSWRNPLQPDFIRTLSKAGIEHYDYMNPPAATGFSWKEVGGKDLSSPAESGETAADFLDMILQPRAQAAYESDVSAVKRCSHLIMLLPCGRSAHLELGMAIGLGKRTAILLESPMEPELMYLGADFMTVSPETLIDWIRVTS